MSFKPRVKKSVRKAAARLAAKSAKPQPAVTAPAVASQKVQEENAKLHKTSASIAQDARGLEHLMDRKRWSHAS